jgi:hypothetical protein
VNPPDSFSLFSTKNISMLPFSSPLHNSPHLNRRKILAVGEKIVGAVSDMMKILLRIVKISNWVSLYLCAVKKTKA